MKKHLSLGVFLVMGTALFGQTEKPMYEVHGQMIYNFIKYIQWPNEAESGDFVVGILGEDDVFNMLKSYYDGKPIRSKKYSIRKIQSAEEASTCQVVYVGKNKAGQFDNVKQAVSGKPILTITDSSNLGKKGSCINFKVIDGKLKFELNQASVSASSLKIAGQLSSMAILL
jgi:YfiR/HmsC-like